MGIAAGILLKGLGFGRLLLGWLWDILKGVFKFAVDKPFQFLVIVLSLALIYLGWYAYGKNEELVATQKIVEEKILFIKGQDKTIKEYVKALDTEKKNHVKSINRSNNAVADLKRTADAALARAQAAGRAAERDKEKFDQLGRDYGRVNDSTRSPEERIKREEETNDAFIEDWRKAK